MSIKCPYCEENLHISVRKTKEIFCLDCGKSVICRKDVDILYCSVCFKKKRKETLLFFEREKK